MKTAKKRARRYQRGDRELQLMTVLTLAAVTIALALAFWPDRGPLHVPRDPKTTWTLALVDLVGIVTVLMIFTYRQSQRQKQLRLALNRAEIDAERGDRHLNELRLLGSFATHAEKDTPPQDALAALLNDLPGLVGADTAALFLPSRTRGLKRTAESGEAPLNYDALREVEALLANQVVQSGHALLVPKESEEQLVELALPRPTPETSFIAIPVDTCDGNGALILTSLGNDRSELTEHHIDFLELFLGTLTRNFDRASRLESLERDLRDTKIANDRQLEERSRLLTAARSAASEKTLAELRSRLSTPLSQATESIPRLREFYPSGPSAEILAELERAMGEVDHILESHTPETRITQRGPRTDVDSMIKGVVALHTTALRQASIETRLELSAPGIGPGENEGRLHQALEELLLQSMNRLEGDRPPRWLTVRSLRTAGCLRIVFWDNGEPLSLEALSKLMAPEPGTTEHGLHVAASLLGEIGGDLRAQNPNNGGLEQVVEIPLSSLERDLGPSDTEEQDEECEVQAEQDVAQPLES